MSETTVHSSDEGQKDPIPQQLKEGWDIYCAWAEARARAGDPLPPGGVFLLQRESIIREELAYMYERAVTTLRIPPDCVKFDLNRADDGRLYPAIDVDPPTAWLNTIKFANPPAGQTIRSMAQTYIRSVLDVEYDRMKQCYEKRCAALEIRRAELEPLKVIDGLATTTERQD